ncbi:MAG: response regulator [Bacteroidota bacterium]
MFFLVWKQILSHFFLKFLEQHIKKNDIPILFDKATDGHIAVEKAKKEKYDAILMNLEMPVMDGWRATKLIRVFDTTTPIIAWSAHRKYFFLQECLDIGMNDYAQIDIGDFLTEIFDALERVGVKV